MIISLNWLKDYVDINGFSVDEITERLTMSGLEVEDVINQQEMYKGFIVGLVKTKEKHPNADRLSVCTVNTGQEDLQVICGAPNVEANQKVVFAPVGVTIPKGKFKLNKAKIRGVESYGMICAEDELELGDDHSGIIILDENLKEGTPITDALKLNDVLFEIAITPNRPDALSHIGVARDLAALFNKDLKLPKTDLTESSTEAKQIASIIIEDEVNCPRYSAKVVTDVEIKESPEWLKLKLQSIGLRPINNVVDVTNFILHEIGQPLHAFDLDLLSGRKIIVKSTTGKEKFVTLDSKERTLEQGTLMICDDKKRVAIAGVMGGENSEVTASTKNILIESAYFNPSSIRKTSKNLQLSTDSSYRFERGTDPSITLFAAQRAAQLIAELSGGTIAKGAIDVYPEKILTKELKLRLARIEKVLGYTIKKNSVVNILQKLGLNVIKDLGESLQVVVPTFRPDIEREIDLIEEVARIAGYDNIPTVSKISITLHKKDDESYFTDNLRNDAIALGLHEMINNPLLPESVAKISGRCIKISNPQSKDMEFLRTSLVTGSLPVVAKNINKGEKDLALFEIGNIFNRIAEGEIDSFDKFEERTELLILLTGKKQQREWYSAREDYDFFDLKGVVNSFFNKISLDNVLIDSYNVFQNSIYEYLFTKSFNKRQVALGGQVKKDVLKKFDINQDVFCFEINISELKNIPVKKHKYVEPLKYPRINRDFAFIFDKTISYEEVKNFILKSGSGLLKSVKLFDLFESAELGGNKKSMAFALEYYDTERTLTEEEVEKDFINLINLIKNKFNAVLRGN